MFCRRRVLNVIVDSAPDVQQLYIAEGVASLQPVPGNFSECGQLGGKHPACLPSWWDTGRKARIFADGDDDDDDELKCREAGQVRCVPRR